MLLFDRSGGGLIKQWHDWLDRNSRELRRFARFELHQERAFLSWWSSNRAKRRNSLLFLSNQSCHCLCCFLSIHSMNSAYQVNVSSSNCKWNRHWLTSIRPMLTYVFFHYATGQMDSLSFHPSWHTSLRYPPITSPLTGTLPHHSRRTVQQYYSMQIPVRPRLFMVLWVSQYGYLQSAVRICTNLYC